MENTEIPGLAELKKIGAVTAERLRAVGIETPDDLERSGAVEAYRRVKERYPEETTLVLLYALQGALWDCHWNGLSRQDKEQLKAQAGR